MAANKEQGTPCVVTLTPTQAKRYYDWFGRKQDSQGFYEDAALHALLEHAAIDQAQRVFELGCGTGRFARQLFRSWLAQDAIYLGLDLSQTMTTLAKQRLTANAARALVVRGRGERSFPLADQTVDRVLSSYVLDLLSVDHIRRVVAESHRVLRPGGRLCLASLTHGISPLSRLVSHSWRGLFRLYAPLVGGCRPVQLLPYLDTDKWEIGYHQVITQFGVPSEVVIASSRT